MIWPGEVTTVTSMLYCNAVGTMASFVDIGSLAIDSMGNSYAYDSSMFGIRKVTSTGMLHLI